MPRKGHTRTSAFVYKDEQSSGLYCLLQKLKQAVDGAYDETRALDQAHKEIYKHLENDQFPRFRRSTIYFGFLEKLLPRSYAEKWKTDFKALLDNQVCLRLHICFSLGRPCTKNRE